MARLRLDIDTRSLKKGAAQIRLRINHKGTSAYYGTGVYVEPQYFVGSSLYDPVSRKAPTAAVIRERVGHMVGRVDEFLNETDRSVLDRMTATDTYEVHSLRLMFPIPVSVDIEECYDDDDRRFYVGEVTIKVQTKKPARARASV